MNLILSIVTVLIGLAVLVSLLRGSDTVADKKPVRVWSLLAIAAGLAAPVLFLLTESISRKMTFVDVWTIPTLLILAVQIVFVLIVQKVKKGQGQNA